MAFALYWLGEYANMILMSAMTSGAVPGAAICRRSTGAALSGAGRSSGLFAKICLFFFVFIWVQGHRAALPL
jgi:NADH-quinone oxidoreductase subunit H